MATVRKRNGKFQVQIRLKGQPSVTRTFLSKKEAVRWGQEIESNISQTSKAEISKSDEEITLGYILERYYQDVAIHRKWHRRERSIIRNYQRSSLYDTKMNELNESAIAQYRDDRLKTVRPATIVRELAAASHCITIAQDEWGINITTNPFKRVRKPKVRNIRERRLSKSEWVALSKADATRGSRSFIHIVEFAIETAMRKGELLAATRSNLNMEERTLYIPVTKNEYPRTIPLTPRATEILKSMPVTADCDRIFGVNYSTLSSWWTELLKSAGIRNLRWHDLRHEGISRFFEYGLNVPEVALISGHRDYQMLKRYTHIKPQSVAAKLARLSGQT